MAVCSPMERMIVVAARQLEDGASVGVGTGAPCAAAMLAKRTHAPNLLVLFEAGGIHPELQRMPISVGDSRTHYRGAKAGSMGDVMELCARGMVDYAFLGGAQIDAFGNLNSTLIGKDHERPSVRFPGSGGANDYASYCRRTIVMTVHDKRRFVSDLDFVTSPGWLTGGDSRQRVGLPQDTGPYRVVTDLALMGYSDSEHRMCVISLHSGVEKKQILENTGFDLDWPEPVPTTPEPSDAELVLLRSEIDPDGLFIGR